MLIFKFIFLGTLFYERTFCFISIVQFNVKHTQVHLSKSNVKQKIKRKSKKPISSSSKEEKSIQYPFVIDHLGRTWLCDKHLQQKKGLQRDRMMYEPKRRADGTLIPWKATLGPGQSMLRRRPGKGQVSHFEEDNERWLHHYGRLLKFRQEYNHTDVPPKYHEDTETSLCAWCIKQRHQYSLFVAAGNCEFDVKTGKRIAHISKWRIKKLKDIGFDFSLYLKWEDRLAQLRLFFQKYNHSFVPKNGYDHVDPSLYHWVKQQRREYRDMLNGKDSAITPQRKLMLDELLFEWNPRETQWNEKFHLLKEFHATFGHFNIPLSQTKLQLLCSSCNSTLFTFSSLRSLHKWVVRQREVYRRVQSISISESQTQQQPQNNTCLQVELTRIDKLQQIGFDFEVASDYAWEKNFQTLVKFKQKEGHCNVPLNYEQNPALGIWVSRQRRYLKSTSNLTSIRKQRLNQVGFLWDLYQMTWDEHYQKLLEFQKKYNHVDVPLAYKEDLHLSVWVNTQRSQYRKLQQNISQHHSSTTNTSTSTTTNTTVTLTNKRIALLNQVHFKWNIYHNEWEEKYNNLKSYHQQYGHSNVPKNYNDTSLYTWVQTQRKKYRLNSLSQERISRLELIDFIWNTKEDLWFKRFTELKEFYSMQGHCRVPIDYPQNAALGKWVSSQRVQFKKWRMSLQDEIQKESQDLDKKKKWNNNLMTQRMEYLNEIEFDWVLRGVR